MFLGGNSLHISSSSVHQIMFVYLLLSLRLLSSALSCQVLLWKVSLCTVGLSLCCYWQVQLTAAEVRVQWGEGWGGEG